VSAEAAKALEAAVFGRADEDRAEMDAEDSRRRQLMRLRAAAAPSLPPKPLPAALAPAPASEPPALPQALEEADGSDSDGSFDLFAEKEEAEPTAASSSAAGSSAAAAADSEVADDAEGYMRLAPGDAVGESGRFVVQRIAGQGVFATVAICEDRRGQTEDAAAAAARGSVGSIPGREGSSVAIKVVRANERLHDAAMKEAGILASLAAADPQDRRHVVRMRGFFEWRGHACLVFEPLQLNLRELVDRYGKSVGLSASAVRTFGRQLLLALQLLRAQGVVHADVKPQNIVVSSSLTSCKLCDLGSAFREDGPDNVPTPLLVSRYYRAPEVILGLRHTHALDLWSLGCVLFEAHTGSALFTGRDDSDMLWQMMALRGPVHAKLVRSHLRQYEELGLEPLFDADLRFVRHSRDPATGEPVRRHVVVTRATEDLGSRLVPPTLHGPERRAALQLKDLLERILCLDRRKRISVEDAMAHPFFAEEAGRREAEAEAAEAAAGAAAAGQAARHVPARLRPAAVASAAPSAGAGAVRRAQWQGWRRR